MAGPTRITVLGVYRLHVDDATVALHPRESRIPPGPRLDRVAADIRDMLEGPVLVEPPVTYHDARLDTLRDPSELGQGGPADRPA